MKILHIITGLETGGAEMMLLKLCKQLQAESQENSVISLSGLGPVGEKLEEAGVPVTALHMSRGGLPSPWKALELARRIRRERADVIQCWMYHANFLGGIAAKLANRRPVVWNIRATHLRASHNKRSTLLINSLSAKLASHLVEHIICCSEASLAAHVQTGYPRRLMSVIPNGFELEKFRRIPEARQQLRQDWGIPEDAFVVGNVGRFDPVKDHATFFRSARKLLETQPNAWFILAGDHVDLANPEIASLTGELAERTRLLGKRSDMAELYSAMDALLLCSKSESFPNVLGEAMSCETPCVSTEVGDAKYILGQTGAVCPVGDSEAIAKALVNICQLSKDERSLTGRLARARVSELFDIAKVANSYSTLYEKLDHRKPMGHKPSGLP